MSYEHGERCHPDILSMKRQYQEKWNPNMLANYWWTRNRVLLEQGKVPNSK